MEIEEIEVGCQRREKRRLKRRKRQVRIKRMRQVKMNEKTCKEESKSC